MDYSQFLSMIPEVVLMTILIVVFAVDFFLKHHAEKGKMLYMTAALLTIALSAVCLCATPVEVFSGMYTSSLSVNLMKFILTAGTFIVIVMAQPWLNKKEMGALQGEFYMLVLSTLLGMYMMMSSGHFLMFFLGLEMASVPMACLVALDKQSNMAAEAGAKFILTAVFSSGVMLFGLSMLYGAVGTLYFADFAELLTPTALSVMGLVFFFSGLGFKISLVPFHFWTADTYQGATTSVTGYLSVISKGAAAFTLMTILTKVFIHMIDSWQLLLSIVVVLSITIANLYALRQKELKRFMAFSSISQAGYIMLAVLDNGAMGSAALIYYVLVYVVANMAVFTVISLVEHNNGGTTQIDSYNGFYTTNPRLAFLMTLALFSLAGIPPFAGMFSKFFVFMAAAKQGSCMAYIVVFIALINTVASLYYYLLIVKAMYIKSAENPLPTFKSDTDSRVALFICTAGIALFGVCSCIYQWIYSAC